MSQARVLRRLLAGPKAVIAPGAANALTARIIEEAGFDMLMFTGAGFANFEFGVPDLGLTTMTEVVEQVARITNAVGIPVLADGDTGYGNALNVQRTVRDLERAGAAGIFFEDQVFPKRCGHFGGKEVISQEEMALKLKAALDARTNSQTVIIARTDAYATHGLDAAIDRAQAYADIGVDATFVEAPQTQSDLAEIPKRISVPQVANIVEGGKTPALPLETLEAMGFRVVFYANAAMRAAAKGMKDVLEALRRDGTTEGVLDRMVSWPERQRLVKLAEFADTEARYAVDMRERP
ncbi:MAG TPA: oxaloacetate decarboxylase [Hyphomicrobiaceae bacterium]|nr:oxaloacetate decarboxylase [Hyphomicrobiaceae bacterium]